jgi:hypothetical protein
MGRTVLHGTDQSVPNLSKLPTGGINMAARVYDEKGLGTTIYDENVEKNLIDGEIGFIFDVATDGGEVGSYTLGTLPAGTIVLDGIVHVIDDFSDTGDSSSSQSSSSSSQSTSSSSSSSESSQSTSSSSSNSDSSQSTSSSSSSSSSSVGANLAIGVITDNDIFAEVDPTTLTAGLYDLVPVGTAATGIRVVTDGTVTLTNGTTLETGKLHCVLRCLRTVTT